MRALEGCFLFGMAASCLSAANSIPANATGESKASTLASPYQPYKLKLFPYFIPPARPHGLFIKARINGGPQLRLLLDSGAEFIVLDKKSAAKSGHAGGKVLDLVGAGKTVRAAAQSVAATVDLGELAFRNCPIVIVDGKLAEGIDGVVPLSLFSGFQVRLDVPARTLGLAPYSEEHPSAEDGFVKVRTEHRLLFIASRLEGWREANLLFDTGSSFNIISNTAAAALNRSRALAPAIAVQPGAGAADGRLLHHGIAADIGGRAMALDPVVAIDLSEISRRHQMEVSGVIGHPALLESVVTIDYRDSMIRIANAREERASR